MEKLFHLWFLFMILFVSQFTGLLYRDPGAGVLVLLMKAMGSALPGKTWNTYVLLNERGLVDMLLIGSTWQHCRIFTVLKTAAHLTVCDMNCPETYPECKTKPLCFSHPLCLACRWILLVLKREPIKKGSSSSCAKAAKYDTNSIITLIFWHKRETSA